MYPTKRASPLQESFVYSTMTEVYTYEHKPIDVYTYVCTYIYIYTYTQHNWWISFNDKPSKLSGFNITTTTKTFEMIIMNFWSIPVQQVILFIDRLYLYTPTYIYIYMYVTHLGPHRTYLFIHRILYTYIYFR